MFHIIYSLKLFWYDILNNSVHASEFHGMEFSTHGAFWMKDAQPTALWCLCMYMKTLRFREGKKLTLEHTARTGIHHSSCQQPPGFPPGHSVSWASQGLCLSIWEPRVGNFPFSQVCLSLQDRGLCAVLPIRAMGTQGQLPRIPAPLRFLFYSAFLPCCPGSPRSTHVQNNPANTEALLPTSIRKGSSEYHWISFLLPSLLEETDKLQAV